MSKRPDRAPEVSELHELTQLLLIILESAERLPKGQKGKQPSNRFNVHATSLLEPAGIVAIGRKFVADRIVVDRDDDRLISHGRNIRLRRLDHPVFPPVE